MNLPVTLAISALVLTGLAVTPFLLPAQAKVTRTAIVPAAPEIIYSLISTTTGFDQFNPFRDRDPGLTVSFDGPTSGIGASFSWSGKEGSGTQTISGLKQNQEVVMQLDLGKMGKPVQTFTLAPVAGGTQVTWSLVAHLGDNPVARVFGLMLDGMLGSTYEQGLANLASVAGRT